MAWKNFTHTLGGATAEALSATSIRAKTAIIQPKRANANPIYLGGSGVIPTNGLELVTPQAQAPLDKVKLESGYQNGMDLQSIYVIGTSGEGVQGIYEDF